MLRISAILAAAFGCLLLEAGAQHRITVTNNCNQQIWVGTFGENEIPANGGFPLSSSKSNTFTVRKGWLAGRIWGRTGCNAQGTQCETGDCGAAQCRRRTVLNAVTLAEFGMDGSKGLDFWDISLVDGFNLPMSIAPVQGTVKSGKKCKRINCNFNFGACRNEWKQFGKGNKLNACKSACTHTKEDRFCCPKNKGYNEGNCKKTEEFKVFKNQCPDAFSYAFDEKTSTFACESSGASNSSYVVTFCP